MNREAAATESTAVEVRCPRCGYDQRGVMPTWIESCPLEGTCAECGLTYRWAEVLRPEKFEPAWCVEFAAGRRSFARASLGTFMRSFWPWGFWTRIKLAHPVRFRRLLGYGVVLMTFALMPYIVCQAGIAIYVRHHIERDLARLPAADAAQLRMLENLWLRYFWDSLNAPLWNRWRHLHDLKWQYQIHQERIASLEQMSLVPPMVVDHNCAVAAVEAVLFPASSTSWGILRDSGGTSQPYPPPEEIHEIASIYLAGGMRYSARPLGALRVAPFGLAVDDFAERFLEAGAVLCASTALLIVLAISLVLLPVSRRRAKVRWRHISRVVTYGAFIPASAIVSCTVLAGVALALDDLDWADAKKAPALVVPIVGGFLWWWAAISRYLKIRHGFFVALLLTILSSLFVAAVVYYGFGPGREMF